MFFQKNFKSFYSNNWMHKKTKEILESIEKLLSEVRGLNKFAAALVQYKLLINISNIRHS